MSYELCMARLTGRNGRTGGEFEFAMGQDPDRFRSRQCASINDAMGQHNKSNSGPNPGPNPERQPDKQPDKATNRHAERSSKTLRPGSEDGPFVADRATVLAHELNNLLDGTMRCLGIAQQSLAVEFASSEAASLETARQQMETVQSALERMCELVHTSMMAEAVHNNTLLPDYRKRRLNDAIAHAVEVVRPGAEQSHVSIDMDLDESLDSVPAGPIYSAILNALRNAVESVNRTGHSGRVHVVTRCDTPDVAIDGSGGRVIVEVHDEGIGLPSDIGADELFAFGRSTKGSTGIGLGVIREIAQDMNGSVELLPRGTMGACLRMTFPLPTEKGQG